MGGDISYFEERTLHEATAVAGLGGVSKLHCKKGVCKMALR